jgi:hypothetical protein
MKGDETQPMRTQIPDAVAEAHREEHDYLVGLHPYAPCAEDRNAYKIVSAPFAHPDNREYNGE